MNTQLNFNTIDNKDDFSAKAEYFLKSYRDTGAQFNQFVRATVYYFYHNGNCQVSTINRLLEVAFYSKGLNYTRLLAFLREVIPHVTIEASKDKKKAPSFGAKKEKAIYDWPAVLQFLAVNPQWFKYGKEPTSAMFSLDLVANQVAKKLLEHGVNPDEFIVKLRADITVLADKRAKKQA